MSDVDSNEFEDVMDDGMDDDFYLKLKDGEHNDNNNDIVNDDEESMPTREADDKNHHNHHHHNHHDDNNRTLKNTAVSTSNVDHGDVDDDDDVDAVHGGEEEETMVTPEMQTILKQAKNELKASLDGTTRLTEVLFGELTCFLEEATAILKEMGDVQNIVEAESARLDELEPQVENATRVHTIGGSTETMGCF